MSQWTRDRYLRLASYFAAFSASFYIFMSLVLSYVGESVAEVTFFISADGWCDPYSGEGLGDHCWGDFGLPYHSAFATDVFDPGSVLLTNTPITILLFKLLTMLSYNLALLLYLGILAVFAFVLVFLFSLNMGPGHRVLALLPFGLASFPILLTFDRGNHTVIVVALFSLVIYLLSPQDESPLSEKTRIVLAVLLGALAFSLKFWAPLVVLLFLVAKKVKEALWVLFLGIAMYIIPFLLLTRQPIADGSIYLSGVLSREFGSMVVPYSVSLPGLVTRIHCTLSNPPCLFPEYFDANDYASFIGLVVAVVTLLTLFLIFAISLQKGERKSALSSVILMPVLALPEAGGYNSAFFIVLAGIWFQLDPKNESHGSKNNYLIGFFSLLPLLLIPVGYFRQSTFALFPVMDMWRAQNLITPAVGAVIIWLLLTCLIRNSRNHPSTPRRASQETRQ